jgi:hypothetical protein
MVEKVRFILSPVEGGLPARATGPWLVEQRRSREGEPRGAARASSLPSLIAVLMPTRNTVIIFFSFQGVVADIHCLAIGFWKTVVHIFALAKRN